jgi:hypothetical protein
LSGANPCIDRSFPLIAWIIRGDERGGRSRRFPLEAKFMFTNAVRCLIAVVALLAMSGCGPARVHTTEVSSVATYPPPVVVHEERVGPPPLPRIEVQELHEVDSGDPGYQEVVGKIVNRGDKGTSSLSVSVYALDAQDRILAQAPAVPERQMLPAGGETLFTAAFPRSRAIEGYKVEAAGR